MPITIFIDEKEINGYINGSDEMWDEDLFYQIFIDDDGNIFKVYYNPGHDFPIDCIDYSHPIRIVKEDSNV